jgi:hypothetical protein
MICLECKECREHEEKNNENYLSFSYSQENKIDHPDQQKQKVCKKNKCGYVDIIAQKKACALSEDYVIEHTEKCGHDAYKQCG